MNRALQPDLHPDAEVLNAFLEQALPASERSQVLDHIAGCGHCRQIVFLSRRAAEEAVVSAALAAVPIRREAWYRNWGVNWRLAWAPAAAFALIVAVAIVAHLRRLPGEGQIAQVAPPARQQAAPSSSPQETVPKTPARPASPVAALKSAKKSPAPTRAPEPSRELLSETASSGAMEGESGSASPAFAEPPGSAAPSGNLGQGAPANAPIQARPEPAVAAWTAQKQMEEEVSRSSKAAGASEARLGARMEQPRAGRAMAEKAAPARGGGAKSAIEGSFEPAPARSLSYDRASSAGTPKAEAATLPSGLAVLSSATLQHRTVAIDLGGALFVKDGAAGRWEPVARQWTGRLVQVRAEKAPESGKADATAAPTAGGIFEIANSGNQVWASLDGKIWKAQ